MAKRRYRRYDDGTDGIIGLFILFILGTVYSIVKKYWWVLLIIILLIVIYLLIRFIIDLDIKGTLKKPIVYFEGKNTQKRLDDLKVNEKENKTQIYYLKRGIYGENNLLYTLINSKIAMYIMHDLLLSCDDFKAQIDFIVVTKRSIYILESKNTNAYEEKLREAKSNMLINNMIHNLMSAIEIKVKKEEVNYELIKEFVDEL